MNFWKFLVALVCGVTAWLLIDNPFTNFVEGKRKMIEAVEVQEEKQELEETYILKESTDKFIFGIETKEDFDETDLNQKYDLFLGDCENETMRLAIIKQVLKVDEMQAELFLESHNDYETPFITNLNILEAKAYKQAFTNAACDCNIDKTIY